MAKIDAQKANILTILLASILMDVVGVGIVIPLLPYYAQSFGASPSDVGILFGLYFLMGIFSPTLWGNLSDHIGRRPALLFNIAGTTVSFLCLSFANSLWLLFCARAIAGASSASIVIAQSYVSDLTTTEHRTKILGLLQAAAGIGFIIGPAIGGILAGSDPTNPNFRLPMLAATIASGLTFCLAFLALPRLAGHGVNPFKPHPSSPQQFLKAVQQTFQRPLIKTLMILVFIIVSANIGTQAILALWCEKRFGWGPQQFGYLIIFFCLTSVIIQIGFTGRLARWLGEAKLLSCSISIFALGLLLFPFSTTVPQLLTGLLLILFATATGSPALTSLLSQLSGAKQQGQTLGLMQSISGLASFLGSIGAGVVFGTFGENWPFWISAVLMAMGALFAWLNMNQSQVSAVMRRRRQQKLLYLFDLLDQNQSNVIEVDDFQKAAQNLAHRRGWLPGSAEYDLLQASLIGFWEMLQQQLDRDNNQQIDRAEWLLCLDQQIDYDFANHFLQIIDTNRDGAVVMDELRTFYKAYGIQSEELELSFRALDLNQDGYISREEFREIFAQFLYSDDVQAPGNWIFGGTLPRQL